MSCHSTVARLNRLTERTLLLPVKMIMLKYILEQQDTFLVDMEKMKKEVGELKKQVKGI